MMKSMRISVPRMQGCAIVKIKHKNYTYGKTPENISRYIVKIKQQYIILLYYCILYIKKFFCNLTKAKKTKLTYSK